MVRLRITRQPHGSIDGLRLNDFVVGFVYDLGTLLGCYLLAEGLAEPVADDTPALVPPVSQTRFIVSREAARRKGKRIADVVAMRGAPRPGALAGDKGHRRRKKR